MEIHTLTFTNKKAQNLTFRANSSGEQNRTAVRQLADKNPTLRDHLNFLATCSHKNSLPLADLSCFSLTVASLRSLQRSRYASRQGLNFEAYSFFEK